MILSTSLRPFLEPLEPVVRSWPWKVPFDHVVKWVLQFEPEDYGIASRIVQNINLIGTEDTNRGLAVAYGRLKRKAVDRGTPITWKNTIFASIGAEAKSGSMISYMFRTENRIPEDNFSPDDLPEMLSTGMIKNVVLIDDVLGTGRTASEEAQEVVSQVTPLGVENVFVLTVAGFDDAVEFVEENAGSHAFSAYTYSSDDTVKSLNSKFYLGLEYDEMERVRDRIKYYNRISSKSDFGYGDIGALIVFRHNTPNVTIPVIWAFGNGWTPLFRRSGVLKGISQYRKQFSQALDKLDHQPGHGEVQKREDMEVTLLVEGSSDEQVIGEIIHRKSLTEYIGVKSVKAVSIGAAYRSGRLIELLDKTDDKFVIVLDDDSYSRRWLEKNGPGPNVPSVLVPAPGVESFIDIPAAIDASVLDSIPDRVSDNPRYKNSPGRYMRDMLRRLGFGRSARRTSLLLDDFPNSEVIDQFCADLKEAVDRLVENEETSIEVSVPAANDVAE